MQEKWAKKLEVDTFTNLFQVSGDFYRSEQPQCSSFDLLCSLGLRSILNLRSRDNNKAVLADLPLNNFHVSMLPDKFGDPEILMALRHLLAAPKPILVHCQHGSDRTGVVFALYRIIFENWSKQDAIKEMKEGGFGYHVKYTNIPNYVESADIEKMKRQLDSILAE